MSHLSAGFTVHSLILRMFSQFKRRLGTREGLPAFAALDPSAMRTMLQELEPDCAELLQPPSSAADRAVNSRVVSIAEERFQVRACLARTAQEALRA